MDLEYILEELEPLDYHKESKCLTLMFPENIVIFLREWEYEELMWHVFENKQSIHPYRKDVLHHRGEINIIDECNIH